MKKIKIAFTFLFLILTSCCGNQEENGNKEIIINSHEYNEIAEYKINWEEAIFSANHAYFVYIYSKTCLHCNVFKDEILTYRLDENVPIYFCEFTNQIPILSNVSGTIGKSDINEIGILGTPSLITIEDLIVTSNVAGEKNIREEILFQMSLNDY